MRQTSKRGFAPVIILLIVALVGAGAYFYGKGGLDLKKVFPSAPVDIETSPTTTSPAETSDLVTYSNPRYKYELMYPKNWVKVEGQDQARYETLYLSPNSQADSQVGVPDLPSIQIGASAPDLTANSPSHTIKATINRREVSANVFSVSGFYAFSVSIPEKDVYVKDSKAPLVMQIYATYKDKDQEKLVLQILSTFKSTN